jgi:hypothetical protein
MILSIVHVTCGELPAAVQYQSQRHTLDKRRPYARYLICRWMYVLK